MNPRQFKEYCLLPNLRALGDVMERDLYKSEAVDLMMGTAAQESMGFRYVRQLENGPAASLFQIEPDTFRDVFVNLINYRPNLETFIARNYLPEIYVEKVENEAGNSLFITLIENEDDYTIRQLLINNMGLSVVVARLHYWRRSEALPNASDPEYVEKLASYWKRYYNTQKGKGTTDEFVMNFHRYEPQWRD